MVRKILLVESDPPAQQQAARVLRDCRCDVVLAESTSIALTHLARSRFDGVVIDFALLAAGGCDLPSAARRAYPSINIILTIAEPLPPGESQPLQLQGFSLLTKPLRIEELARALEPQIEAVPSSAVQRPSGTQTGAFSSMIGNSERMKKIYRLVSKVAKQRHPVLILGESGTGKELVARAVHENGPWRTEPFVPIDCGALPPTLIESELFGHVKGAFTGATLSRQGLLATAGTGTVFLDEIGELPIELQSRLLRALQEHDIRPLGSNERVKFEARIIAATNQDLEKGVKNGTFRKDLFFRLNVVTIKMPPLRERKEDIPALARHFLERYDNGDPLIKVSDEALGRLMCYDWPGNIRELENCMQRAISLGSGKFVQIQDLPSVMLYDLTRDSTGRQDCSTLQALEQQAIRQALDATGGDRVRAAKLLGIGKTTIYRKLKEYGMESDVTEL